MKTLFLPQLIVASSVVFCASSPGLLAADSKTPGSAPHPPAANESMGLKKELIEGITPADFLRLSAKPKTVKLTVIAAYTAGNYGMNFNGFSFGKATYTIPAGWTVEIDFINPSPVPHSAIVVEKDQVKKLQMGDPAFKGASVPKPVEGISTNKASFQFTADEAGDYAIACGFPSHALAGHWVALEVSAKATVPTLKLGDAEPVNASPAR
jgi:sulfocyanin